MKIAIVDDNNEKVQSLAEFFASIELHDLIVYDFSNVSAAVDALREERFDILLVDLVLPMNLQSTPSRDGGRQLLERLRVDNSIQRPTHIVGITSHQDAYDEFADIFAAELWPIFVYHSDSDDWKNKLKSRVEHVVASETATSSGLDYDADVCFVCALADPELKAVRALDYGWEEVTYPSDPTRYFIGKFTSFGKERKVLACAAAGMGMPLTAGLVAKICITFRPRIIIMTGICAGREGECEIGDIIVANPSWDYGSGKFHTKKNRISFKPDPSYIPMDAIVRRDFEAIADDDTFLTNVRNDFPGEKPKTIMTMHIGPMASGAAVRSDDGFFEEVAKQNRKVLGLDMEAYGVFSTAHEIVHPIPKVAVLKGVQDFADGDKGDKYRSFAAYASASAADKFVRNWKF